MAPEVVRRAAGARHVRKFSIATSAAITLTSEYIQNLSASGRISATGDFELAEPLWLGEEPRSTVWAKQ